MATEGKLIVSTFLSLCWIPALITQQNRLRERGLPRYKIINRSQCGVKLPKVGWYSLLQTSFCVTNRIWIYPRQHRTSYLSLTTLDIKSGTFDVTVVITSLSVDMLTIRDSVVSMVIVYLWCSPLIVYCLKSPFSVVKFTSKIQRIRRRRIECNTSGYKTHQKD